jgi:hypothetical protein
VKTIKQVAEQIVDFEVFDDDEESESTPELRIETKKQIMF